MQHGRIRVALFGSHGESRKCRGGTGAQADSRAPGVRPEHPIVRSKARRCRSSATCCNWRRAHTQHRGPVRCRDGKSGRPGTRSREVNTQSNAMPECLDALHGERRDRSILFWKSLPVSDLTTVLSKASIPLVVLPLLTFTITVAMQLIMLLLSSAVLLGSGLNVATLWTQLSFVQMSLLLLYHLMTVHALWPAPIYGWL